MIELIGIVACILACIGLPFQVAAIKSGKAFEKTPDKRADVLAATRRQFTMLFWAGIVLGIILLGLAFVRDEPGEGAFKVLSGFLWLVLAGECFWARKQIAGIA